MDAGSPLIGSSEMPSIRSSINNLLSFLNRACMVLSNVILSVRITLEPSLENRYSQNISPLHTIREQQRKLMKRRNLCKMRIVYEKWFVSVWQKTFLPNVFATVGGLLTNTKYFFHRSKRYFQFLQKLLPMMNSVQTCFHHVSTKKLSCRCSWTATNSV